MSDPVAVREALIIEAIGEAARLIDDVSTLSPVVRQLCQEINQADTGLREALAAFEARMAGITETAKTQTVRHLAAYTEQAARRSVDQQSQAMADAARIAFGAQVGSSVEQLRSLLRALIESRRPGRKTWLTHAATAAAAAVATWMANLLTGSC